MSEHCGICGMDVPAGSGHQCIPESVRAFLARLAEAERLLRRLTEANSISDISEFCDVVDAVIVEARAFLEAKP